MPTPRALHLALIRPGLRLGCCLLPLVLLQAGALAQQAPFPRFEAQVIDPKVGNVCYALTTADVDGDGKLDVVAVTEDAVVWYRNPDWTRTDILRGTTERDNVCIAAQDIDGDGRIDFALGAGWRPPDSTKASTLQWLGRDAQGQWQRHPIAFDEPLIHRIRWADLDGKGRPHLIVAPLQGRGTKGPDWGAGNGVKLLALAIPSDPKQPAWPTTVLDDTLHTVHNVWPVDDNGDGRAELLAAAWEGVFRLTPKAQGTGWTRTKLGTGNQESSPNKGASEIKQGRMKTLGSYIATIEPWHGHQVVVYAPEAPGSDRYVRQVIDEPVSWGHAVWCADLDGDGDDELIIGQRDPNAEGSTPRGPGVRIYQIDPGADRPVATTRHLIDDGGMACEDAVAADLDGDGRVDLVAGGRATHNVKIYWNRGPASR